jgi:hypothetical protein
MIMYSSITSSLLMIRPVCFAFNEETAADNHYQKKEGQNSSSEIQKKALHEFDVFVNKLTQKGVHIQVFDDTPLPQTPDSIFPNNWISFHGNQLVLYPMLAKK